MTKLNLTLMLKFLSAVLILTIFFATPAFAQNPLSDFANWYVDAVQNNIKTTREILQGAADFAADTVNNVLSAVGSVFDAIVDVFTGQCPQAAVFYQNHLGGCWSCTFFDTIFTAINSYATETYNRIAMPCISLMIVFAMIWIGVFTIKYIAALNEQKPEEYLTKLFGVLLRCLFVGVLLGTSASTFSNLVISPIIVTTSDLSVAILQSFTEIKDQVVSETEKATTTAECDSEEGCAVKTIECNDEGNCKITEGNSVRFTPLACELMKEEPEVGGMLDEDNTGEFDKLLNDQIYYSLMCMVNNMHYETAYVIALADAMMCYSWTANTAWLIPFKYLSLKMLLSGVLIFIAAILISIAYVFKLIDALFRLCVLCVLLPLLAVAWVFPPTVEFAKKGFGLLIHVVMVFISLAIVVSLVLMLVLVAFTSDGGDNSLYQLFNENRIYDMKDLLDFYSLNFVFGLISLFLAFKLLNIIDHVATEFSGVDIGSSIGDQLSMILTKCTSNIAKGTASIAKAGAGKAGHAIGERIAESNMGSRFHTATRNFNYKAQQAMGFAPAAGSANLHSTANMSATDKAAAHIAGTAQLNKLGKDIATAEQLQKINNELTAPNAMSQKHRDYLESEKARLERKHPDAAKLAADPAKLKQAKEIEARAQMLEAVHGKKLLNSLADEQKEQMLLGKSVDDKDNLQKVDKNNSESLKHVEAQRFEQLESKAKLAEKVRSGNASDDEKEAAAKLATDGDRDMYKLLVMQDKDFNEQMDLIKDTRTAADGAKTSTRNEFEQIAKEQEQMLEAKTLALDIAASKGTDIASVNAYNAIDDKYKDQTYIDKVKADREKLTASVTELHSKGWQTGDDDFIKGLADRYAPKLGDKFDETVWKA